MHVNAHATSTPEGDTLEAQALAKALGAAVDGVVVTSTKSMTGHLLGGAGAIESVAAIMALKDKWYRRPSTWRTRTRKCR